MGGYNKLWVALVGAAMIGFTEATGFEWPFLPEDAVGFTIGVLTALGVWAVPNQEG